jgi:hypothetical protein
MKVAVVYFSVLGSTAKYARWLAEEVKADVLQYRQATDERLGDYDVVVACSGTYGGWLPLTGFLKKHWRVLSAKRVIALAVGSVPLEEPSARRAFETIPEGLRQQIVYHKLPCHSGLRLWLTGPFSAYSLWKHADARDWRPSKDKLEPVVASLQEISRELEQGQAHLS